MIHHHIKKNPMTSLVFATAFGILFLVWYYTIDGQVIRQPLKFNYDIQNIAVEKSEYRRGEMVRIKVNFCKTRYAEAKVQWSLVDGRLTFFPEKVPMSELPKGCYPNDPNGYTLVEVEAIPNDPALVDHEVRFEGVGTITLSGNREVKYSYKTETFRVVD